MAAGSTAGGAWTGTLAAGTYIIAAVHAAPDSRVDYTLGVNLKELVSGQRRDLAAPASVPVSLVGGDVEISSFGDQDGAGANAGTALEWFVDGQPYCEANVGDTVNWPAAPGQHVFEVETQGAEVRSRQVEMRVQ